MKLLLVEDTKNKSEKIESFLKKTYSEIGLEIIKKESYHSASKEIFDHGDEYFVILLDMTMSTFDATNGENGGEPEPVTGHFVPGVDTLQLLRRHTGFLCMSWSFV